MLGILEGDMIGLCLMCSLTLLAEELAGLGVGLLGGDVLGLELGPLEGDMIGLDLGLG